MLGYGPYVKLNDKVYAWSGLTLKTCYIQYSICLKIGLIQYLMSDATS
jgi:hypothetical protein